MAPLRYGAAPQSWRIACSACGLHRTLGVLIPPVGLNGPIRLTAKASLSAKSNWRRGRDSNPRYLAVHCISNAARSTTLPPLLCYQLEGASKGGQGVGQGRRKCIIRGPEAQRLGGTDNLRPRGWEALRHGMTSGVPAITGQLSLWASGPLTTLTSRRPWPRSPSGRRCG